MHIDINLGQARESQLPQESKEQKYFRNAEVLFANKDFRLARVIFSELHRENPQKAKYLERLAECYSSLGETGNAELAYEQLLSAFPVFRSFIQAGNFYLEQKNFVRAKSAFLKGICHQEEDYVLLFDLFKNLGNVFYTKVILIKQKSITIKRKEFLMVQIC